MIVINRNQKKANLRLLLGIVSLAIVFACTPASAALRGYYYSAGASVQDFGALYTTRDDATVDFGWGNNSPFSGWIADGFLVSWRGQVTIPTEGTWNFYTITDDGTRLYVDGQRIIDQWQNQGDTEVAGSKYLTAGQHEIVFDYFENGGGATARLSYEGPGVGKQIIPNSATTPPPAGQNGVLGRYYTVTADTGTWGAMVGTRIDSTIDSTFDPPGIGGLTADQFGVRWAGRINIPVSGNWTLFTSSDDGARFFIDDNGDGNLSLVIDHWNLQGTTEYSATLFLCAGFHDFAMEYYEWGGGQIAQLRWQGPNQGKDIIPNSALFVHQKGLITECYGAESISGVPIVMRNDYSITYNWGEASPQDRIGVDNFAMRWVGKIIIPTTGSYTFYATTDDGNELWVNGQRIIDDWPNAHGMNELTSTTLTLTGGTKYYIDFRMHEGGVGAGAQLRWAGPTIGKQYVAKEYIVPILNEAPSDIVPSDTVFYDNEGANATVCSLATTDIDNSTGGSQSHTYTLVSGAGSTHNGSFNISGNALRVNNAASMPRGTYSVRIRTTDNGSTPDNLYYEEAITIECRDATAPVIYNCPASFPMNADSACRVQVPNFFAAPYSVYALDPPNGAPSINQSPSAGSYFSLGANTVTITANDGSSYSPNTTCTFTVTVVDVTDPVITTCPAARNISANGSCQAAIPDMRGETVATDNCSVTVSQDPPPGTLRSLGLAVVTMTATDGAGRTATCTVNVTVVDTTKPIISTCPPARNIPANASCTAAAPDMRGELVASDNCDASLTITQTPPAGSTLSLGPHTVTMRATDDANNYEECTVTVTVIDNTNPVISTCPAARDLTANASCTVSAPDMRGELVASDNCDASLTITQTPAPGSTLSLGPHTVTMRATDDANNYEECTVAVTVVDQTKPVITVCPPARNLSASASCEATLPDLRSEFAVSDNCDSSLTIAQTPSGGATLSLGPHTVTMRATDDAGNFEECTVNVTVVDDTDPVITVCPAARELDADDTCQIAIPDLRGEVTATDNCGTPTITQTPAAGWSAGLGLTTVTIRATDGAGLYDECTVDITVADNTAPIVDTCPADRDLTADASCEALVPDLVAETAAHDNCDSAPVIVQSIPAGTPIGLGDTDVTITVTDGALNEGSCLVTLTVVDETDPVIDTCPTVAPMSADENCEGTVPNLAPLAVVSDNCDPAPAISQSLAPGTKIPLGDTNVTFTVKDTVGNDVSCVVVLTVEDTTGPEITLNGSPEMAITRGFVYTEPGATAADNCDGGVAVEIGGDTVDTNTINTYYVTYDAHDSHGNNAVQVTRIVHVTYDNPPVITVIGDNPAYVECGGEYIDAGATADDVEDGDLTGSIETTGLPISGSAPGTYHVTYKVEDSYGTTIQEVRTVIVRDTIEPAVTINGETSIELECGGPVALPEAVATDECDDDTVLTLAITRSNTNIIGAADTSAAGNAWDVVYSTTDRGGNTGTATVSVTVVDTAGPEITLNGEATMALEIGASYIEPGAAALDTCEGSVAVTIGGDTVNTAEAGTYVVTYNAEDGQGHPAAQKTRTIIVTPGGPPTIVEHPANLSVSYGADAQFSVTAVGLGTLSYQWRRNGTTLVNSAKYEGVNTRVLTVNNCANADEAGYSCRVISQGTPADSNAGNLVVKDPDITQQPQSQVIQTGTTAVFQVGAVGSGTLVYHWFKAGVTNPLTDGGSITGAATAQLRIANAQETDAGGYYVTVENGADPAVTSDTASLFVGDPGILEHPQSQTVQEGSTFTFHVVAVGTPPLFYQWKKDGVNLHNGGRVSGANSPDLRITGAMESDEGEYTCTVIGQNIVSSNPATLTVVTEDPPVIASVVINPSSGVISVGGLAGMTVIMASGTEPFSYQWKKDGVDVEETGRISGVNTATLSISAAQSTDSGAYTCVVLNAAGMDESDPVTLRVGMAITGELNDALVKVGSNFTWIFTVEGAGASAVYEWQKDDGSKMFVPVTDGGNISGSETNALQFSPVESGDDGLYRAIVTSGADFAATREARLHVVENLPVAGVLGLGLLSAFTSLGALVTLRKRAKR